MSHTILILEDELTILENLGTYLEDEGFKVLQAQDAATGIELLAHNQPDLAVVDIRLPDSDGNQWMLDAHAIQPNLRYIVYTGLLDYKPSKPIQDLGIQDSDVIYKPVENMDLISQLIRQKLLG